MDDTNKSDKPTEPKPAEPKKYIKWELEKDFVTDTGSGLALRLERHIEKLPMQYRWSFGVLVRQQDNSLKFILGVRPWIDRRGGYVTVKDDSTLMLMLVQRMQEYVMEKEQLAENEWRKRRPPREPRGPTSGGT